MNIGFDLQVIELAGKEKPFWDAQLLSIIITRWREHFPDDRLIGYGCEAPAADLPLDEVRRWEFAHPREKLLDAGPMASHAWRADCLELDWLIVPEPLALEMLPPGGSRRPVTAASSASAAWRRTGVASAGLSTERPRPAWTITWRLCATGCGARECGS